MSIFNAILFGVLQGFTEILPISSSAHLALFGNLFGLNTADYNFELFTVFLHFGTIIAVIISFFNEISKMTYDITVIVGFSGPKKAKYPGARLSLMILTASAPLLFLLPINKYIGRLYINTAFIGAMLIVNGVILMIADRFTPGEKDWRNMSLSDAFLIGLIQLTAAIPGISRTGVVTSAGMATGQSRTFSIQFALLLSLPLSFGNNVIKMAQALGRNFSWSDIPSCLIGLAAAILSGIAAISIIKRLNEKSNFHGYSYYCWVAGVMFIILTMIF